MSLLNHPLLTNDFQRELTTARSGDFEVKAKAHLAFTWLVENKASELLFKTIAQCTKFKPTPGFNGTPSHWTSPPPGGPDKCIVIVMSRNKQAMLQACASNAVEKPLVSDEKISTTFFADFAASRSKENQARLLHDLASSAPTIEHSGWVDRVYKDAKRYRTTPIFLIVLDGDKPHFYATTALVEAPPQTDRSLEWTGKVSSKEHAA